MADRIVVVLGGGTAELTGRPAGATFDGSGACLVELGDRRTAFATGNFYAPVATTSHHLGPLRRTGLVTSRRDGTRILDRIADPRVVDLCAAAGALADPCEGQPAPTRR
jgi:hypothetical protein